MAKKVREQKGSCPYCTGGYIIVGQALDSKGELKTVTMECGYCLGTSCRLVK
jgi:hypothetical protein